MKIRNVVVVLATLMSVTSSAGWATPQYFPGTGHYYDVIADFNGLSWSEARAAAEGQIWQGVHGYLACITSEEENLFAFNLTLPTGIWYTSTVWEIGPWLGGYQLPGSEEPAGGWVWLSDEPWIYSCWFQGGPNNNGYQGWNENCLGYWGYAGEPAPTWNDYTDWRPVGLVYGYVVEFDGPAVGACCFMHICVLLTEDECTGNGGNYLGTGTTCQGNPCEGTPARATTWGSLKSEFRR